MHFTTAEKNILNLLMDGEDVTLLDIQTVIASSSIASTRVLVCGVRKKLKKMGFEFPRSTPQQRFYKVDREALRALVG